MSDTNTNPPVVNIEDVLANPEFCDANPRRGDFEARFGFVGRALNSRGIGVNITIVPPRSKAFPRHYHYQNDEMFLVLSGVGTLHYGDTDYPLKPMDVISILAGTGIPFQIDNTGDEELRYLALSTMTPTDVFHYPDSNKYGIMANGAPFRALPSDGLPRFAKWVSSDMSVGYWEGEVAPEDEKGDC
ncbi:MAG: cupin domain-containing protein [Pseudomonadota bacterium]